MLRRFKSKRITVALAVVAVLAVAGGALAYFSSTGSGTGQASVGRSTAFTVNVSSDTSGSLYPGSGTETLTYTVHNPGSGAQNLSATSASVASLNGDITQGGAQVTGCKATWFSATNTPPSPLPQNLAGGATSSAGSVAVQMSDSGTNQDPCQGAKPDITVSAS
jgi:predicted ribosomally synthesized peptide with SipW-like signal peptide